MAPGDASSPGRTGIAVGDFTGNMPGLILRGNFNSFSYPPPGPAASAGSHLNPGTVSPSSLARTHPTPPQPSGFIFCRFEFYKILRVLPQIHTGGGEGGRRKDKGPNAMCGRIVCLYILRYIYTGFKPTNTNCSFGFLVFFLDFFFISCFFPPPEAVLRGEGLGTSL